MFKPLTFAEMHSIRDQYSFSRILGKVYPVATCLVAREYFEQLRNLKGHTEGCIVDPHSLEISRPIFVVKKNQFAKKGFVVKKLLPDFPYGPDCAPLTRKKAGELYMEYYKDCPEDQIPEKVYFHKPLLGEGFFCDAIEASEKFSYGKTILLMELSKAVCAELFEDSEVAYNQILLSTDDALRFCDLILGRYLLGKSLNEKNTADDDPKSPSSEELKAHIRAINAELELFRVELLIEAAISSPTEQNQSTSDAQVLEQNSQTISESQVEAPKKSDKKADLSAPIPGDGDALSQKSSPVKSGASKEQGSANLFDLRTTTAEGRKSVKNRVAYALLANDELPRSKRLTQEEIANQFKVSERTVNRVYKVLKSLKASGSQLEQDTFEEKDKGRPMKEYLTEEQFAEFKKALRITPDKFGLNYSTWTGNCILEFFKKEFKIVMSLSTLSKYLERKKITSKVATKVNPNCDPAEVEAFKRNFLLILLSYMSEGFIPMFEDETGLRDGGAKKGYAPVGEDAVRIASTKTLHTGKSLVTFLGFTRFFSMIYEGSFDSEKYLEAIRAFLKEHPGEKFVFFQDNYSVHLKVKDMIESNRYLKGRIKFEFLPKYCPKLNPVEFWNCALKNEIKQRVCKTRAEVINITNEFVSRYTKGDNASQRLARQFFKAEDCAFIFECYIENIKWLRHVKNSFKNLGREIILSFSKIAKLISISKTIKPQYRATKVNAAMDVTKWCQKGYEFIQGCCRRFILT